MLNYKKYGEDGDIIIILHGLFGSLDNWHTLATEFGSTFLVYTVDLRNHGKSFHDNEINYKLMANDFYQFMNDLQIDKASFIGHSMGGKVAMQLALNHPEKIEKLLIADMGIKKYKPHHTEIFDALQSLDIKSIKNRHEADAIMALKIPDFGVRQFLLKNLIREGDQFSWRMNLQSILNHYDEILDTIQGETFEGPVLFVKGEKSEYILEEDWQSILSFFPNSELKIMFKVGHWIHAEDPKTFASIVFDFMI